MIIIQRYYINAGVQLRSPDGDIEIHRFYFVSDHGIQPSRTFLSYSACEVRWTVSDSLRLLSTTDRPPSTADVYSRL